MGISQSEKNFSESFRALEWSGALAALILSSYRRFGLLQVARTRLGIHSVASKWSCSACLTSLQCRSLRTLGRAENRTREHSGSSHKR
jgi:hypothetical protein